MQLEILIHRDGAGKRSALGRPTFPKHQSGRIVYCRRDQLGAAARCRFEPRGLACKSRRMAAEDRHRRRSLPNTQNRKMAESEPPSRDIQRHPPRDESAKERLCPPCGLSNTSARTVTRKSTCGSAPPSPSRWRAPTSRPRASTLSALPVLSWSTRSAKSSSFLAAGFWLLVERREDRLQRKQPIVGEVEEPGVPRSPPRSRWESGLI